MMTPKQSAPYARPAARRRPRISPRVWAGVLIAGAAVLLSGYALAALPAPHTAPKATGGFAIFPPPPNASTVPLKHIVILMMENHAYDNYFGTYCRSYSPLCAYEGNGTPPGTCVPMNPNNTGGGCIKPFRFTTGGAMPHDQAHDWKSSHLSYNGGAMNGYYLAEGKDNLPFGYWDGGTIPGDWVAAEEYGLGDYFFSSVLSYSLPNHWFMVGAAAPPVSELHAVQVGSNNGPLSAVQEQYLNESNNTPEVDSPLLKSLTSWKMYDHPLLSSYNAAINDHASAGTFGYWDPLAAPAIAYTANYSSHFTNRTSFFTDTAAGRLPNVSWLIPTSPNSDHPPGNVTIGMEFISSVIQAIENSPDWNSTTLFVTWDEFGGFWDQSPPPQIDAYGLGFRVPLLVVGPYVREGYVSDHLNYFESILKLVEWRYGLTNLTARDQNAPLPLQYFDFSANPRAPLPIFNGTSIRYPETLQYLNAPPPVTNFTATPGAGSITLTWSVPKGGSPVTWYRLHYGPPSYPSKYTLRVDGAADGYVLTGLPANVTYGFNIRAVAGVSNDSTVVSASGTVKVPAATPVSPAPSEPSLSSLFSATLVRSEFGTLGDPRRARRLD